MPPPPHVKQNTYSILKNKLEKRTGEELLNYHKFVETAKLYENIINWDIAYIAGYNSVVKLSDGYFTTFLQNRDVSNDAYAILELSEFCRNLGIEFCYVNVPHKVCMYEDSDISGTLDFSNQNTNTFLDLLSKNSVKYYDLRKILHSEGMSHHESFFITDHHWKPETGLWAARKILEFLKSNYNWNTNPEVLNPENFEHVIYHDWFLGSQGKKVTLMRAKPENISLLYPKCDTSFKYEIPDMGINTIGDFAVTYEMKHIEIKDYYSKNPYGAYNHADRPLIKINNILTGCEKKILIVHDSYFNCVIPFLAMNIREIDSIDMRHFNGSLQTYIKYNRPDALIVSYHSGVPGTKDRRFYLR